MQDKNKKKRSKTNNFSIYNYLKKVSISSNYQITCVVHIIPLRVVGSVVRRARDKRRISTNSASKGDYTYRKEIIWYIVVIWRNAISESKENWCRTMWRESFEKSCYVFANDWQFYHEKVKMYSMHEIVTHSEDIKVGGHYEQWDYFPCVHT